MAQYRKFWLINSLGNRYDFTSKNSKIFLNTPQGLGLSKNIVSTRIGDDEQIESITINMPKPSGELLFYKQSNAQIYQDYQDFIQFAKHRPLEFHQQTPNTFNNYFIRCELVDLEKTEVSPDGILHCPLQVKATSLWLTDKEYDLQVSSQAVGNDKTYPYEYPYTYGGNSFANINLDNNGTVDCGFKFEINNEEVSNPTLSLFQEDNGEYVKYGEIKLLGTFDVVRINTNKKDQQVYLEYQGSVLANPTSYLDISGNGDYDTPFPYLKVGNNRLTFSSSGTFEGSIDIKWRNVYSTI